MCIIFLDPKCLLQCHNSGPHDLQKSLNSKPYIGKCVNPTSTSPIHCAKLQVRHRGGLNWYKPCKPCTKYARDWRCWKVNECEAQDKQKAEELKKRQSFEFDIVQKERLLEKQYKKRQAEGSERPLCAQLEWEEMWTNGGWDSAECHNAY